MYDAETGKYKRHWGAYGHKPDDTNLGHYNPDAPPAQQFRNPVHCAELSNDGLLYVCDRANDRIQVFKTDGTFVKEVFIAKNTLGDGSVWDIAFSKDPQQKYIYLADGANEKIYILAARFAGDSDQLRRWRPPARPVLRACTASPPIPKATSTRRRPIAASACRSSSKGLGPVTKKDQGVVWPKKR